VESVLPMQVEEVIYKLEPYFHNMSQSLSYICMAVGIATPENGIEGEEFVIFQSEINKLLSNFRITQNIVKQAIAEK